MISIVWQGDHRYNVYRSGQNIGCVTVSNNPYHNQHRYLNLGLDQYDPAIAKELFSLLRKELGQPLQVMLYSTQAMYDFLTAGGFERKRRCYEVEVSSSDLATPLHPSVELHTIQKGAPMYATCCELLYATHLKEVRINAAVEMARIQQGRAINLYIDRQFQNSLDCMEATYLAQSNAMRDYGRKMIGEIDRCVESWHRGLDRVYINTVKENEMKCASGFFVPFGIIQKRRCWSNPV